LELHRGGGRSRTSGSPGLQEFDGSPARVEPQRVARICAPISFDAVDQIGIALSRRHRIVDGEQVIEQIVALELMRDIPEIRAFQARHRQKRGIGVDGVQIERGRLRLTDIEESRFIKLIDTVDLEGGPGTSFCSL
jgi:hypothetical protein